MSAGLIGKDTTHVKLSPPVNRITDAVVTLRWPELGFQETRTSAIVADHLSKLGLEVRTGIAKTGVVGILSGSGAGRMILMRANMHGLPIQEASSLPHASQNDSVMHACGHDRHTAILLGVASVLSTEQQRFSGIVRFVFQPAEELPPGGAKGMIAEGVVENPHVNGVFALHLWNSLPVATIGVDAESIMASVDCFNAIIRGLGDHGAYSHTSVDPVVIGSHIVTMLQSLVDCSISVGTN